MSRRAPERSPALPRWRNICVAAGRGIACWTLLAAMTLCAADNSSPSSGSVAVPYEIEAASRQQAIADFTQKMKDANYPALFEKAAQEFNVPPDVLKGVSFAETRWIQLEWPPGETGSPENGMPHAYGIMSLWDNDYFGHTLIEAAKLIGRDPQDLKTDVYQNMRGGAALLRKLYDETPKPADAPGDEIESWRKAIAKYTGIPQPELSEQHALRVYKYMNQGYHQYGMEWPAHPVNLGPMREDVARIQAAARARLDAKMGAQKQAGVITPLTKTDISPANLQGVSSTNSASPDALAARYVPTSAAQIRQRWLLSGLMLLLLAVAAIYRRYKGSKAQN